MNKLYKNIPFWIISSILIFSVQLYGQPGGGGGIQILNYTIHSFNYQIENILPGDSNLYVDFYEILEKGRQKKYNPMPQNQYRFYMKKSNGKLDYIPSYIFDGTNKKILRNQRIDFLYKDKDTATVIFTNIPEENPSGESFAIDTLHLIFNKTIKFDMKKYLENLSKLNRNSELYDKLKRGLTLSNLNLLIDLAIVEYVGVKKSSYKVKINRLDTVYYSVYREPMYVLNYRDINLMDTEKNLKSEEIHLFTDNLPELKNGKLHYKFHVVNNDFDTSNTKHTLDSASIISTYLELNIFTKIDTVPFLVNNNLYSGIVKLVIPSYWHDVTLKSNPTFDLVVLEFNEGKLIKLNKIKDVGDLYSEHPMSRPSR